MIAPRIKKSLIFENKLQYGLYTIKNDCIVNVHYSLLPTAVPASLEEEESLVQEATLHTHLCKKYCH